MKYNDFKIFKFSTISKNINLIRDSLSGIYKKIKNITGNIADSLSYILKGIFSGINKSIKFIIYNFLTIYKLIDLRKLDFKRVYKYFDIKRYNFYRINKNINLTNYFFITTVFINYMIQTYTIYTINI